MDVRPFHTVPEVDDTWPGFRDMPPVFATAMMIGFIEQTCIEALRPFLTPDQRTVGTRVNVNHLSATPVGLTVTADIELVEHAGNVMTFQVACYDDAGLIGEGHHDRVLIALDRFMDRVRCKLLR
nr:thioesterase family protein [uncultured Nitratireductor sp.]